MDKQPTVTSTKVTITEQEVAAWVLETFPNVGTLQKMEVDKDGNLEVRFVK